MLDMLDSDARPSACTPAVALRARGSWALQQMLASSGGVTQR